jgi:branched-chain amino acid aminotransferase
MSVHAASVFWVDGELIDDDATALRPDDHGLVGDGAFEAIKVRDGRPFALSRHLRRLERSAGALGLTIDRDLIERGISVVVADEITRGQHCWLRVTVTGGSAPMGTGGVSSTPTVILAVAPMAPWGPTSEVAIAPWSRNQHSPTAGLKTISYADNVIALRWAHHKGADEGLFTNTSGALCEGTGSNLFAVVGNRLVTPPLSAGCLAGVTRALLIENLPEIVEADITPAELRAAPEAFLTSTSRDVHPIATVDGVALPAAPGPHTTRAIEAFARIANHDDP